MGLTALLAVVAAVIVIKIKNKDGTETEIKVPDDATIEKNGKEVAKGGPDAGNNTPAVPTSDRAAAEWVLSIGGEVRVEGYLHNIKAASALPKGAFKLRFVDLVYNTRVSDAGLAHLRG